MTLLFAANINVPIKPELLEFRRSRVAFNIVQNGAGEIHISIVLHHFYMKNIPTLFAMKFTSLKT